MYNRIRSTIEALAYEFSLHIWLLASIPSLQPLASGNPPIEQQHGVDTTLDPGKHPSKMGCPADAQPAERSCTMKRLVEIILEGHYRHSDAAMSPTTEMCKLGSSKELSYCHISITIIIGAALIREPAHEEYPVSWHSS